MKKLQLYGLIFVLFAFCLSACKKTSSVPIVDNNANLTVMGKWMASYPNPSDNSMREVYQFNVDSTYSFARLKVNLNTGQPTLYQYMATGKFRLNGTKLQLYGISAKYNDTYVSLDKLVDAVTPAVVIEYALSIDTEARAFHFVFPPCPINADCVPALTYYLVK